MESPITQYRLSTLVNALDMLAEADTKIRLLHDELCGPGDFFHENARPILDNEDMHSFRSHLFEQIGEILYTDMRKVLTDTYSLPAIKGVRVDPSLPSDVSYTIEAKTGEKPPLRILVTDSRSIDMLNGDILAGADILLEISEVNLRNHDTSLYVRRYRQGETTDIDARMIIYPG